MKKLSLLLILGVLFSGLVGCGNADGDLGTKGGEGETASVEAQIKKIEDDPNMPPAAKAAAIGAIQSRADAGKQMGEAMKNTKQGEAK